MQVCKSCIHVCNIIHTCVQVSVPLNYGSLFGPQPLDELYKAERKKSGGAFR